MSEEKVFCDRAREAGHCVLRFPSTIPNEARAKFGTLGDLISLPLPESCTIGQLKQVVERELKVPAEAQRYLAKFDYHNDNDLVRSILSRDDSSFMGQNDSAILILRIVDDKARTVPVYITGAERTGVVKNCTAKMSILQFKERLVDLNSWDIAADQLNILKEGQLLRDDMLVGDVFFAAESKVEYVTEVTFRCRPPEQTRVERKDNVRVQLQVHVENIPFRFERTYDMTVQMLLDRLLTMGAKIDLQLAMVHIGDEVAMPHHLLRSYSAEQLNQVRIQHVVPESNDSETLARLDSFIEAWKQLSLRYDTVDLQGTTLASFEVETGRPLGHGANGQVFPARLLGTNHRYALKKIWDVGIDRKILGDVEWEVPMQFPHEHIGRVLHTFLDTTIAPSKSEAEVGNGRTRYLVMDLYEQSLEDYIASKDRRLTEREVLLLILPLLQAIAHLYRHGISHRDIKLSDICLAGDDLYLVDFGCATKSFVTKYFAGNRANMPPEGLTMMEGEMNTKLFDVWAVGCIIYLLVGERHPFHRDGSTTVTPTNPPLPQGYEKLTALLELLLARDMSRRIRPEQAVRYVQECLWPLPGNLAARRQKLVALAHELVPPKTKMEDLAQMSEREQLAMAMHASLSQHLKWGVFENMEQRLLLQFLRAELAGLNRVHSTVRMRSNQSKANLIRALTQMGFHADVVERCCRTLEDGGRAVATANEIIELLSRLENSGELSQSGLPQVAVEW